jgi:hypothetical protein
MPQYPVQYVRDKIAELIEDGLYIRRASIDPEYTPDATVRAIADTSEIDAFLLQCPFEKAGLADALLSDNPRDTIELSPTEVDQLVESVEDWRENNHWLGGDDSIVVPYIDALRPVSRERFDTAAIKKPEVRQSLIIESPSVRILYELFKHKIKLVDLHWREFEELIAELLNRDGYDVTLGSGSKDQGVDIFATRLLSGVGIISTVWQAKKLSGNNKVGLNLIRELADTTTQLKASKGIIVTSTFLTKGALSRIVRDQYQLGKLERPEVDEWIQRVLGKPHIRTS